MLIQEAIKKAEAVNGGIMNKAAKVNGVYYSPIGNFDSFMVIPIGKTLPKLGDTKLWTPCSTELLGDDWEVYEIDEYKRLKDLFKQAKATVKESLDIISAQISVLKEIEDELRKGQEK